MSQPSGPTTDGAETVRPEGPGRLVAVPAYLGRFRCVGSVCEDSCCGAWQVPIDAAALARLRAIRDPAWNARIQASILAPGEGPQAATMRRRDDGMCCMLGADRRCDLQSAYGEAALPDVCFHFPRLTIDFDGVLEQAATFSCPEVARLALLDPSALDVLHSDVKLRPAAAVRMAREGIPSGAPLHQARLIRQLTLELLRVGEVRIETRLLALGWVLTALDQGSVSAQRVQDSFGVATAGLGELDHEMLRTPPEHLAHLDLVRRIAVAGLDAAGSVERFRACVHQAGQALFLYNQGTGGAMSRKAISAGLERTLKPYLATRPWLLTNLLSNTVRASTFPFRAGSSMADEYLLLVGGFLLIRLLLVGVGLHRGSLTDDIVVEVVQSTHRVLDHARSIDERILTLLHEAGLQDANRLAAQLMI